MTDGPEYDRLFAIALAIGATIIAAMVLVTLLTRAGWAHDHERPDLDQYYRSLKSNSGTPCCDGGEATHVRPDDWTEWDERLACRHTERDQDDYDQHGHYCVRLGGVWWNVSDKALVLAPNKSGDALVWPYYDGNPRTNLVLIRCFQPGPGA